MADRLRAISLWQPWASAIAVGVKSYETRSWPTKHRGWLAIHAAKRWKPEEPCPQHDLIPVAPPLGAIIAVAVLSTCWRTEQLDHLPTLEQEWGNYGPGRFAWQLMDVHALTDPIPVRGRQGLWTLSEEETQVVWSQVRSEGA